MGEELTVVNESGKRRRFDLVFKNSDGELVGVEESQILQQKQNHSDYLI